MWRDVIERIRYETALVAHIEMRDLPKRALLSGVVLFLLSYVGQARAGVVLCGLIALFEWRSIGLYRRVPPQATGIANRLVAAIWTNNALRTVAYLMPTLLMVGTGDTTFVLLGLMWLSGIFTHVSSSFAATPIYAMTVMVPNAAVGALTGWLMLSVPITPAQPQDLWVLGIAFAIYVVNIFETLIRQADTSRALTQARNQVEAQRHERDAALAARTEAERRFQDIAAASEDWFWEIDAEGRIRYLGNSFAASTGLDPGRVLGRSLAELGMVPGGAVSGDWAGFARLVAARAPIRGFVMSYLDPGRERLRVWLRLTGLPWQDAQGAYAGYRGVCTNVTPYLAATERAEAANRAKSQFLAVMSHELRTPLTAVLGMAELLRERAREPEAVEMVDTIRRSGEGLMAVLNDVLDLARIEAGKMTVEMVPYDPADLAQRCAALFGPRAEGAGLTFEVGVEPEAQGLRTGDPNRILQVLTNLIGNAVKFTERGGIRVRIGARGTDALHLVVEDDGIGMTEAQQARIFEEFEQAESSTTRRYGGSGLGLAITRHLVDLMGGTIALTSAPGRGTRFDVQLPAPPAPAPEAAADRRAAPAAAPEAPADPADPADLAGLRALVADDNATNRRILAAFLSGLGVEATLAADGAAAVAAYAPGAFDVLLLDISMPGLDGPGALAEIRRIDAAGGTTGPPALAVTAHAMRHQIEAFVAAGFAGHVAKPFSRDSLRAAVAAAVAPAVDRTGPQPQTAPQTAPQAAPAARGDGTGSAVAA